MASLTFRFRSFELSVLSNSPNCEGSYYFQSFQDQVITGQDDSNKTWKDYWFYVGGAWEAHPDVLKTYGQSVPTTWNLNWQCVDAFEVVDDVFQRVLNILEMLDRRKNCQVLTQPEVLDLWGGSLFVHARSSINIASSTLSMNRCCL